MRDVRGVKRGYCKDCEKDECPEFIQNTTDCTEKVSNFSCAYCGHLPVKHARCTSPTRDSDKSRAVVILDFKTGMRNSLVPECTPATTTEECSSSLISGPEVESVQSCSAQDIFCNSTEDSINSKEQERNSTEQNSRLLQEIYYLKTILKEHGTMMKTILNTVNTLSDRPIVSSSSNLSSKKLSLPVPLPLTSHLNLMLLEEHLLADEKMPEDLCFSLAQIGGLNLGSNVRRVMAKVMTNEIAMEFSWFGAKAKLPFHNLKICKVIFDAVRRNNATPSIKDSDIEKSMQDWLRHAKSRFERQSVSK